MSLGEGKLAGRFQLLSYARMSHDDSNRSVLSTIRGWINKLYAWWLAWWDDEGTLLKVAADGRITVTGTDDDKYTMFYIYYGNRRNFFTYRIQSVESEQFIGIADDHVVVEEQKSLGDRSYFQVHKVGAGCIALQSIVPAQERQYLSMGPNGTITTCLEERIENWFKKLPAD